MNVYLVINTNMGGEDYIYCIFNSLEVAKKFADDMIEESYVRVDNGEYTISIREMKVYENLDQSFSYARGYNDLYSVEVIFK